MRSLLRCWRTHGSLVNGDPIALYLDFDGTLAPIATRPGSVRLGPGRKRVLRALAGLDKVDVSIVTGRALGDIQKRVGIKELTYAANHGFEVEGPGFRFKHPSADKHAKLLSNLAYRLRKRMFAVPGVLIEDKTYTLSVHYRSVDKSSLRKAESIFLKTVGPHLRKGLLVLTKGKKVWEIRPDLCWNKGMIVLWLQARLRRIGKTAYPIYIGDDATDEDAFRVLKCRGMTAIVAPDPSRKSRANYALRSVDEAYAFLKDLIKARPTN